MRVWRQEEEIKEQYNNADISLVLTYASKSIGAEETTGPPPIEYVVRTLAALPRINAVEILNEIGNGVVIYPDWP